MKYFKARLDSWTIAIVLSTFILPFGDKRLYFSLRQSAAESKLKKNTQKRVDVKSKRRLGFSPRHCLVIRFSVDVESFLARRRSEDRPRVRCVQGYHHIDWRHGADLDPLPGVLNEVERRLPACRRREPISRNARTRPLHEPPSRGSRAPPRRRKTADYRPTFAFKWIPYIVPNPSSRSYRFLIANMLSRSPPRTFREGETRPSSSSSSSSRDMKMGKCALESCSRAFFKRGL